MIVTLHGSRVSMLCDHLHFAITAAIVQEFRNHGAPQIMWRDAPDTRILAPTFVMTEVY